MTSFTATRTATTRKTTRSMFIAILLIAAVLMAMTAMHGCAGFLKLTPEARQKLDDFNGWAKTWVDGARAQLPMILATASMIPAAQPYVAAAGQVMHTADQAIAAYETACGALKAGASTSEEIAQKQRQVLAAIEQINNVVGNIKAEMKG